MKNYLSILLLFLVVNLFAASPGYSNFDTNNMKVVNGVSVGVDTNKLKIILGTGTNTNFTLQTNWTAISPNVVYTNPYNGGIVFGTIYFLTEGATRSYCRISYTNNGTPATLAAEVYGTAAGQNDSIPFSFPLNSGGTFSFSPSAGNVQNISGTLWSGGGSGSSSVTSNSIASVGLLGNTTTGSAATANTVAGNSEFYKSTLSLSNYFAVWGDSISAPNSYNSPTNVLAWSCFMGPCGMTVTNFSASGQSSGSYLPFFTAHPEFFGSPCSIEIGVNDHTQGQVTTTWTNACFTNIAYMVSLLTTTNYVVWGIPTGTNEPAGNATYNIITNFNGMLKSYYGVHYFDSHTWLLTNYNPANAQDVIDVANDVVPWTLRNQQSVFPWVHLITPGQKVIAKGILNTMIKGWNATALTDGQVKQNMAAWADNSPTFNNSFLRGTTLSTNIVTKTLTVDDIYPDAPVIEGMPLASYGASTKFHGQLVLVSSTNGTCGELVIQDGAPAKSNQLVRILETNDLFNIVGVGGGILLSIDPASSYNVQNYFNTAAGVTGVLGYNGATGAINPWIVFLTGSSLRGVTTMTNISGTANSSLPMLTVNNNSSEQADVVENLMSPNTSAGNFMIPFMFGVNNGSLNQAYLYFNYVGSGSVANSFGYTFYGGNTPIVYWANGNSSSAYNQTNAAFIATGAGFTGNGHGLTNIATVYTTNTTYTIAPSGLAAALALFAVQTNQVITTRTP